MPKAVQFWMKQGDRLPVISATLRDAAGEAVDLTSADVRFIMVNAETGVVKVNAPASLVSGAAGTVKYEWGATDTDTVATYYYEWEVTDSSGRKYTFPNQSSLVLEVVDDLG